MARQIHLLHTPPNVLNLFEYQFAPLFEFDRIGGVVEKSDLDKVTTLIMFSPSQISNYYIASENIWKNYLGKLKKIISHL